VQRIAVGKRKERPERGECMMKASAKNVRCRQNTIVQPSFFACSSVYETPSTFNPFLSKTVIKPPLFPSSRAVVERALGDIASGVILVCSPSTHGRDLVAASVGIGQRVTIGVNSAGPVAVRVIGVGHCLRRSTDDLFVLCVKQAIVVV